MKKFGLAVVAALGALAATSLAGAATVSSPVPVTDDQFAANEESLGMDPSGQILMGMWNDWHYNDGCGISYSTNGGTSWAPESFAPGFTFFTNDPNVPGTGPFAIAGDPVVVYNPKSGLFDVICQAFGGVKAGQIQLLATTFDVRKANPNDPAHSYGLGAWRLPAAAVATGTSNGSQKGSNGKFPDHEARSSGALNISATHTATAGDPSTFTPAQRVKPSGETQFFPWLQSAPNGRVDLVYYDRSCDPNDVLDCVTLSSSTDSGASW